MATTDDFDLVLLNGGSDIPSPDDPADAKDINDAFKQIDGYLGVFPCTSGTRPPSPKYRQVIRETDTGRLLYWDNSNWVDMVTNTPGLIPAGTTAQRDAYYGVPAAGAPGAAARVALANKAPRWFNTDAGMNWEEQYFAATADAGSVKGRRSPTAGWYPIAGRLPWWRADGGTSGQNITAGTTNTPLATYGMWSIPTDHHVLVQTVEVFEDAFFKFDRANGQLFCKIPGRYRLTFNIAVGAAGGGTGTVGVSAMKNTINADSTVNNIGRGIVHREASELVHMSATQTSHILPADVLRLIGLNGVGGFTQLFGGPNPADAIWEMQYVSPTLD